LRRLIDSGDPQTIRIVRKGIGDHDIIKDTIAFAEGILLLERCLKTLEDSDLKDTVQAIASQFQPPPQTPLYTITYTPFFD
jgi:hypothetical protein